MNSSTSPEVKEDKTFKTARDIIKFLLTHPNTSKKQLTAVKCKIGKKYGFPSVIRNSQILDHASEDEQIKLRHILRRRLTRTLSGVSIVAVMTAPNPAGAHSCPGECIFCPGSDSQPNQKVAQSYTGREPAAMRSAMYHYDSYLQTLHRLIDLQQIGHQVDKIELIIMGGTFLYAPIEYQDDFMHGCFDAILNFRKPNYNDHKRTSNLSTAKRLLETAETRLIGITFETRPDYCFEEHIDRLLELGITRIEIGVQTTRQEILDFVHRNHTVEDSIRAIQVAKDSGIKVNCHIMPNLPLSSPEIDFQVFQEIFNNPHYRPDMLKIYPTLVVGGTELYKLYQQGKYTPYPQDKVIELIAKVKDSIPRYIRIQRIQRDIPMDLIIDGVKNSNLRQIVNNYMQKHDMHCKCIRCREEGFQALSKGTMSHPVNFEDIKFFHETYEASDGLEHFLSYENSDQTVLIGYLRLRFPSDRAHRPEITESKTAIVREIRVVGEIVRHGSAPQKSQIQHRGYGKKLMKNAENIAFENGFDRILVIAGIGVREYFYHLGYSPYGPYVVKNLN
ncbi:MAG: tRNA uridine(34) 5-carboxymethylaminomethyl modification radical SAM/GNAT enzyme Elp3 [Candidatus Lokiarchaeota archaeon]|nr:tRNA uridine(34) 5-carboxymethylaminomethyl modification radical SAM/GNAT enzyme Elp3 [Candidatus Harpocratesius repetitus]